MLIYLAMLLEVIVSYCFFTLYNITSKYIFLIAAMGSLFHTFYGINLHIVNPLQLQHYLILSNTTVIMEFLGVSSILYQYICNKTYIYGLILWISILSISVATTLPDLSNIYYITVVLILINLLLFKKHLHDDGQMFKLNPFKYRRPNNE